MNLLLLSSSRSGNEDYLHTAKQAIIPFLDNLTEVVFIPFAGVSMSWDEYVSKVQQALPELSIKGLHHFSNKQQAIKEAGAILVGGGNTFNLLHHLYQMELIEPIKQAVTKGTPYVGWSAGSNIAGNSIRTTNDMPIIQPPSFDGLGLVPFQINPHYSDYQPPGHNGETRAERIMEFCTLNPSIPVVGIREGSALLRNDKSLTLTGELDGVMFLGETCSIIQPNQDLSNLLNV